MKIVIALTYLAGFVLGWVLRPMFVGPEGVPFIGPKAVGPEAATAIGLVLSLGLIHYYVEPKLKRLTAYWNAPAPSFHTLGLLLTSSIATHYSFSAVNTFLDMPNADKMLSAVAWFAALYSSLALLASLAISLKTVGSYWATSDTATSKELI